MTIAVVGAGISGLTLAHELQKRGREVRVFESAPQVGGAVRSETASGYLMEAGPNAFLDREPAMRALVDELGLGSSLLPARPAANQRFIYLRGKLRELPRSPPAFLRSDLLSFGGTLRLLGEVLVPRTDTAVDESVAEFARRHFGAQAAPLADAFQTGVFAGDPERLSLSASFPQLAKMQQQGRSVLLAQMGYRRARGGSQDGLTGALCTFQGGLQTLPLALASRLAGAISTRTSAFKLEREDSCWRLLLRSAEGERAERADQVVLAIPAFAAAELLRTADAPLAEELAAIEYAPVAVVHLGLPVAAFSSPPEGFGLLVPEQERRTVLGVIFVSSLFPGRAPPGQALFSCLVGGARHPERLAPDDSALASAAASELSLILGARGPPSLVHVVRWPRGIPQYNVGHLARLSRIDQRLRRLPELHLTGNAYRGIGVNDCIRDAVALSQQL